MTELVVHCLKKHYPLYDVYIGRPFRYIHHTIPGANGFWGNPWNVEKDENKEEIPGSREQVIDKHQEWLMSDKEIWIDERPRRSNKQVIHRLPELKGKILGCFCRPEKACHGDLLAILANAGPRRDRRRTSFVDAAAIQGNKELETIRKSFQRNNK